MADKNRQENLWRNFIRSQWHDAIRTRRSRRHFQYVSPLVNLNSWLHHVCRSFRPFPEVEAVLVNRPVDKILTGAIGPYGKIRGAQTFVAILGKSIGLHVAEKAGYTGEGIVLEATACGLDTCWVGGSFRREAVGDMASANPGERVYGVIPLGYGEKRVRFTERLFTGFGRMHQRKSLAELVTETRDNDVQPWMVEALKSARLAPSAFNRQPWRFSTALNSITVMVDNKGSDHGMSRLVDCGIAMLHIELGALAHGVNGEWEFLSEPDVARFTALPRAEHATTSGRRGRRVEKKEETVDGHPPPARPGRPPRMRSQDNAGS
jgi:nitroreductase